jgi:hypothetical protein
MIFVYYPEEGKIELSSRSKPKKLQKLFNLFNRVVLDDLKSVDEYQKVFNLDKLLDDDFQFVLDPDYQLDSVYVREIRLNHTYLKKRYVVMIGKGEGVETIKEELKY